MKQLKLTINGELKIFDLPENGEYKCEVEESYVPKEGDCLMIRPTDNNILYWCKLSSVTTTIAYFNIAVNSNLKTYEKGFFGINEKRIYTKITLEEVKAKYAEAGYDWDYDTDTIKPIKWIPKEGDEVWFVESLLNPHNFIFRENGYFNKELLEKGLLFPTEEECQKFADHCMEFIK